MVDIFAENDGLGVAVGGLKELGDSDGDQLGALVEDKIAIHVALIVFAVLNFETVFVELTDFRPPAVKIFIEPDAHDFIGREKPIVDALAQ